MKLLPKFIFESVSTVIPKRRFVVGYADDENVNGWSELVLPESQLLRKQLTVEEELVEQEASDGRDVMLPIDELLDPTRWTFMQEKTLRRLWVDCIQAEDKAKEAQRKLENSTKVDVIARPVSHAELLNQKEERQKWKARAMRATGRVHELRAALKHLFTLVDGVCWPKDFDALLEDEPRDAQDWTEKLVVKANYCHPGNECYPECSIQPDHRTDYFDAEEPKDRVVQTEAEQDAARLESIRKDKAGYVEMIANMARKYNDERDVTLKLLKDLLESSHLQKECKHDSEPDLCDVCAFEREQRRAEVGLLARARLVEFGWLPKLKGENRD